MHCPLVANQKTWWSIFKPIEQCLSYPGVDGNVSNKGEIFNPINWLDNLMKIIEWVVANVLQ